MGIVFWCFLFNVPDNARGVCQGRKRSNWSFGMLVKQERRKKPLYRPPPPPAVSPCWDTHFVSVIPTKSRSCATQTPPSHLLFHFFGAEVQVSVADPLNFEPIFEAAVAAAFELDLEHVDGLLHEASSRGVRVPVELHAVLEPLGQRALQRAPHEKADESNEEKEYVKEETQCQVRFQQRLPLGKFSGIQRVVTNFASKTIEGAG